jgi:hypothetical protein
MNYDLLTPPPRIPFPIVGADPPDDATIKRIEQLLNEYQSLEAHVFRWMARWHQPRKWAGVLLFDALQWNGGVAWAAYDVHPEDLSVQLTTGLGFKALASHQAVQLAVETVNAPTIAAFRRVSNRDAFMARALRGEIEDPAREIDDYVDRWHASDVGEKRSLHDFLGMTEREYATWLETPSSLGYLIRMRADRRDAWLYHHDYIHAFMVDAYPVLRSRCGVHITTNRESKAMGAPRCPTCVQRSNNPQPPIALDALAGEHEVRVQGPCSSCRFPAAEPIAAASDPDVTEIQKDAALIDECADAIGVRASSLTSEDAKNWIALGRPRAYPRHDYALTEDRSRMHCRDCGHTYLPEEPRSRGIVCLGMSPLEIKPST